MHKNGKCARRAARANTFYHHDGRLHSPNKGPRRRDHPATRDSTHQHHRLDRSIEKCDQRTPGPSVLSSAHIRSPRVFSSIRFRGQVYAMIRVEVGPGGKGKTLFIVHRRQCRSLVPPHPRGPKNWAQSTHTMPRIHVRLHSRRLPRSFAKYLAAESQCDGCPHQRIAAHDWWHDPPRNAITLGFR